MGGGFGAAAPPAEPAKDLQGLEQPQQSSSQVGTWQHMSQMWGESMGCAFQMCDCSWATGGSQGTCRGRANDHTSCWSCCCGSRHGRGLGDSYGRRDDDDYDDDDE